MKRYYKPLTLLVIITMITMLLTGCSLLPVGNANKQTLPDSQNAAAVAAGEPLPEVTAPSESEAAGTGTSQDSQDDSSGPGTTGLLSELEPSISGSPPDSSGAPGTSGPAGTSGPGPDDAASSLAASAEETMPVTVYYQDSAGYLIPVTMWIEKQLGVAKAAANCLIGSGNLEEKLMFYGLKPCLPEGSRILGLNLVDDVAVIDFNNHFLGFKNEKDEKNGITSLVYTLTEFDNIKGVKILVNGYDQGRIKFGSDISGVIYREELFINSESAGLAEDMEFRPGSNKVDIYMFRNSDGKVSYLLPVSIKSDDAIGGEMAPETLIQFLLKSEPGKDMYSEIPKGAALLNSSLSAGTLTLDFNRAFISYGGSSRENGILEQILFTLKQNKEIDRLKILVEGEPVELPEGTIIGQGLTMPGRINDIMER